MELTMPVYSYKDRALMETGMPEILGNSKWSWKSHGLGDQPWNLTKCVPFLLTFAEIPHQFRIIK